MITLTKDFEIPALNFQLIKHLVESDEEVEIIRKQILPCFYREDFGLSTIKEIIKRLSELVTGFKGINLPSESLSLKEAIKLREYAGAKVINTSVIVNAKRTNAYLLDDLSQLAQREETDKETVIDTILSKPMDSEDIKDIDDQEDQTPLFPLLSNKAQRLAATKAEKARLLVIQGPPGTGKSQTIVNLICHLVAQGKTILVASHQNKALEVITKIMPHIEYLAMSMLKGDKESINELRNKIEGYHSYVSNVDVNRYKVLLEDRWSELKKINSSIKKLQVRFSELKILEREQCPTYQKYHKIRDYDIIDASDSIPEGMDSSIATALSKYSKQLQRLKKDYPSKIKKLFCHIKIKTIEQTVLKTLPKTLAKIKFDILKGNNIPALEKPELIVEAFRLSSFIREDLLKNPDDIKEVIINISTLKNESHELIKKILATSRRIALKKAEQSNETRFMINKLKHILKRKRKTYSFVQLREQIDYKKLLSVFPCWIMSIEDVARIFPLEAGLFDYLVVDEASQCNQATALHLAYRAKRMVVVGDSKQMKNPNTQFLSDTVVRLNLTKHKLDKHPKAEFFHGRNSLLDLAIGCQDTSPVFLNEHFRCEPPIIDFSNKHFYDRNLKILTPFRRKRFNPCMEVKIINGAYDDPDDTERNIIEARAVIAELKRMIDSGELEGDRKGEKLSVGILSLFKHQATLLQSLMYEAFDDRPSTIKEHEIIVSTVDGFQGDERDIILYSFRYAPNSKPGTIHAMQREDEHSLGRLNVAFTRARRKVVCFISMPKDNFPNGLIRDYLTHVASVQSSFYSRLGNPNEREKCQSDFERDVFDELVTRGLEVYAQVPCAGFFIDFVVIDKEGRRMVVECDGDFHYEDDELREEDYQRQDIIERYGWFVHRIPSRRYYANPQKAIDNLLLDLQRQDIDTEISSSEFAQEPLTEPAQMSSEEISEDKASLLFDSITVEDKIIEILSEEGPMPLWKIAQRIGQPKEEIIPKLEKLLEQAWVITYYEKGVKLWKAID